MQPWQPNPASGCSSPETSWLQVPKSAACRTTKPVSSSVGIETLSSHPVQVGEEVDALRSGLERCISRQQRRHVEEQQRQELLERRVGGGSGSPFAGPGGSVQDDIKAARHVQNSRRVLEEAYETGVGIIGSMAGQRERLKATHRRVLDVLNSVGLSDSVLRLAERRQRLDKLLVYGGMAATLLLVGLLYWWAKLR